MARIRPVTVAVPVLAALMLALLGPGAAAQPDPDHCPPGWERRGLCTSAPEPDDPGDPEDPEEPGDPEEPEEPEDPEDPEDPEGPEDPAPPLDADVVVVVDDDQPGTTSRTLIDHLTAREATVTAVPDHSASDSDAEGADLVVVSPDVSASAVGSTFRDVPVAQVNLRSSNWRPHNQAFGSDDRPDNPTSRLSIVDEAHPAAAGLTGTVDVGATVGWQLTGAGPDMHAVGHTDDGEPALAVYEAGSEGAGGAVFPARRGLIGIDEGAWATADDTLWQLLDGLIDWAVAGDIVEPPEQDPDPEPDPDDPAPEPGPSTGDPDPVDPGEATHTVPRSAGTADCDGNLSDVRPGDVVAIESGDRGALRIANCHGTAAAPIVFVNDGGVVNIVDSTSTYAGLDIRESSHLRISGSGAPGGDGRPVGAGYPESDQDAGIRVSGTQRGVAFKYADFFNDTHPNGGVVRQGLEIDHVEAGPTSKNGFHGPENDRLDERYTVVGFRLHHNYVHDNHLDPHRDGEGFYLGATRYNRHDAARTGDVEVSYNLVARTGRDGIQLGSGWYGDNRFHHNVVHGPGQGDNQDAFCFIFNRGTTGDIHDNHCFDAGRDGMRVQGLLQHRIYNNVLARGGHFTSSSARGIRISHNRGDAPAEHRPDGDWVKVWNNTVVDFPDEAIYFSDASGDDNEIRNNVMYGNGGGWGHSGSSVDPSQITESHNLTADPRFVDPARDDYRLRSGSPAIGAGYDLPDRVDDDVVGTPRPQGGAWDIGAYEYVDE